MDKHTLAALQAYLEDKQDLNSGSIFGMPIKPNTSSAEEIQAMPEDVKNLVLKSELNQAGSFTPAVRSDVGYGEPIRNLTNRNVRMAEEVKNKMFDDKMSNYFNQQNAIGSVTDEPLMEQLNPEKFNKIKNLLKSKK